MASPLVAALMADPNNVGMSEADHSGFGSMWGKLKGGMLGKMAHGLATLPARAGQAAVDYGDPLKGTYDPAPIMEGAMTAVTGGMPFAQAGALGSAGGKLMLYRGESVHNKGGNFYTPDAEWARQFTQSGQQKEVLQRQLPSGAVYDPPKPVYAGDPDAVDAVLAEARRGGFSAVRLSEGPGEPPSVFVFDKSKLTRGPESGSTFGSILAGGIPLGALASQEQQ
jgi:uncharacterized Zn-binding protein involved in type VI secretion